VRLERTSVCLALLVAAFCAGCAGGGDSSAEGPVPHTATTLAPTTTTTTVSEGQVALAAMTIRQKVAQVLLLAFTGTSLSAETSALFAAGPPGGLLVLGYNFTDATQLRTLTAALQQAAAATGSPVGMLIAVDQEGGTIQRIKQGVPSLPSARSMGTQSTPAKASDLARDTARGLLDLGVNMNLAPVADVIADESSFLFDRAYGSDPALVSAFVTAVIQASQDQGLISVAKHFPGHGSASGDTHRAFVDAQIGRQEFESVHLPPFRAAISVGVEGIMLAHVRAITYDSLNPSSLSSSVVSDLLRGELNFQGLVVSDDLFMLAASRVGLEDSSKEPNLVRGPEEAARARVPLEVQLAIDALNAGCDLLILSERETNSISILDSLVKAIEQGEVSQSRLDEAVLRILDLKFRYGIIAPPDSPPTTATPQEETDR
jgi:beta-N-acetylhexosaminidase